MLNEIKYDLPIGTQTLKICLSTNMKMYKLITLFLLFLFVSDALAIWDTLEESVLRDHFTKSSTESLLHFHNTENQKQSAKSLDTCLLCPCCVATDNLYVSLFNFSIETKIYGLLVLENFAVQDFFDHYIYHPPQVIS